MDSERFSPEQLAANALGSHAHRFSVDQIAANALEVQMASQEKQKIRGSKTGLPRSQQNHILVYVIYIYMCDMFHESISFYI